MGTNVGQLLCQAALRHGDRVALVEIAGGARREVSARALHAGACRVAAGLQARGVAAGERVALLADNGEDFVTAWFGIVYAGATVVPVPSRSVPREIVQRLVLSGARVLIVDLDHRELGDAARELLKPDSSAQRPPEIWEASARPQAAGLPEVPSPGAAAGPVDRAPGDDAMLLFTSGTTAGAKGALISHASLMLHTAAMVHHTLGLGPTDVVLGVLPLSHSYGARMVMLASLFAGARAVLTPRFSASESLRLIEEEGVTWVPGVPTMFAAWAAVPFATPSATPPSTVRWCLSAGAPIAQGVVAAAEARLGAEVRQGYGMTEATFSTVDAPPAPRHPGAVGAPVWGVEVRVVDAQDRDLPAGEEGQVLVRGQHVMTGYLDQPEATAQALAGGWMHSGDVGRLDVEGVLTVVDRTKDLIIRGGDNVYPSEVEEVLHEHPDLAQVAVVGRPDDFHGEVVVAFVVPASGATLDSGALDAWAATRLAPHKRPVAWHPLTRLPLGPSGKVLKRALRDRLAQPTPSAR